MTTTVNNKIALITEQFFWLLIVFVVLFGSLYVYFTASSIIDVAERKTLEAQMISLKSEAVVLEMAYLEKEGLITLEYAKELGFVEANTRFVSRTAPVARATLINEN
jgi:hypothetical protein